jgi:hypothetical protein
MKDQQNRRQGVVRLQNPLAIRLRSNNSPKDIGMTVLLVSLLCGLSIFTRALVLHWHTLTARLSIWEALPIARVASSCHEP